MSGIAAAPKYMVASKPAHGQPCNGCGLCCHISQCKISVAMFGPARPCPALVKVGERYACGIVTSLEERSDASLHATAAKIILGAGRGCDCRINGEPVDHEFNRLWDLWETENWTEVRCAFRLWKLKHPMEEPA